MPLDRPFVTRKNTASFLCILSLVWASLDFGHQIFCQSPCLPHLYFIPSVFGSKAGLQPTKEPKTNQNACPGIGFLVKVKKRPPCIPSGWVSLAPPLWNCDICVLVLVITLVWHQVDLVVTESNFQSAFSLLSFGLVIAADSYYCFCHIWRESNTGIFPN